MTDEVKIAALNAAVQFCSAIITAKPDGRIYRREGRELLVLRNGNFFTATGWPWPLVMLDEHVAEGVVSVEDYYEEVGLNA